MRKTTGLEEYWRGYRAAKYDVEEFGLEYANKQYSYGLNGVSNVFAKGYFDYIKHKKECCK